MGIELHNVLRPRYPRRLVSRRSLPDAAFVVNDGHSWVLRDTFIRPIPIENDNDLGPVTGVLENVINRALKEHLVPRRD